MRTGTSCLQIPFLEARVGVLRLPLASPLFVDPKAAGYQPELRSRVQNIFPVARAGVLASGIFSSRPLQSAARLKHASLSSRARILEGREENGRGFMLYCRASTRWW